jgi:hypothetical protein
VRTSASVQAVEFNEKTAELGGFCSTRVTDPICPAALNCNGEGEVITLSGFCAWAFEPVCA